MTEMPSELYPSSLLFCICRRFITRCARAGRPAYHYRTMVKSGLPDLLQKTMEERDKRLEAEQAYTVIDQAFCGLDDAVKAAFKTCEEYHRGRPSGSLLTRAFPGRRYSHIIRAPRKEKVGLVRMIVGRIRDGEAEPRVMLAAQDLEKAIAAVLQAQKNLSEKIREYDEACTSEALARKRFADRYAAAYDAMSRDVGQNQADDLFLNVTCKDSNDDS